MARLGGHTDRVRLWRIAILLGGSQNQRRRYLRTLRLSHDTGDRMTTVGDDGDHAEPDPGDRPDLPDTADALADLFREDLKRAMAEKGKNQADLARGAGIDPGTVSRWLTVGQFPRAVSAHQLDDFFQKLGLRWTRFESIQERWDEARVRERMLPLAERIDAGAEPTLVLDARKVAAVRWGALSESERGLLWKDFQELEPRLHQPRWTVAPSERQEALDSRQPIDLTAINELLATFELNYEITLPMDELAYDSLHGRNETFGNQIAEKLDQGVSDDQRDALIAVYDYLACAEMEQTGRFLREVDVILVPGARRGLPYRVQRALSMYQANTNDPLMIFSGQQPIYEGDAPLAITEAEAMLHFATEVEKVELNRVVLETRARSVRETALHILPALHSERARRGRPLRLLLVTGPYSMRRLLYSVRAQLDGFEHVVGDVACCASTTTIDLAMMLAAETDTTERRYGVNVYVLEYLKLIGGRVVGEF